MALALALLAGVLGQAAGAYAEMYKWVDEDGNVHYTDNLFNVPQKSLGEVRTFEERTKSGSGDGIALKKLSVGYVAEVRLNELHKIRLVVDTGASVTLISPEALEKAGIEILQDRIVRVRTANGEAEARFARVGSISVGPYERGPFNVVAHDAGLEEADGLLGMDFLGAFRVEILSLGPTLRLSPQ